MKFYLLMYSTNSSLRIYDILYYNDDVFCLKRKKDKYFNLVNEKLNKRNKE